MWWYPFGVPSILFGVGILSLKNPHSLRYVDSSNFILLCGSLSLARRNRKFSIAAERGREQMAMRPAPLCPSPSHRHFHTSSPRRYPSPASSVRPLRLPAKYTCIRHFPWNPANCRRRYRAKDLKNTRWQKRYHRHFLRIIQELTLS